jgi:hypothetical protein
LLWFEQQKCVWRDSPFCYPVIKLPSGSITLKIKEQSSALLGDGPQHR